MADGMAKIQNRAQPAIGLVPADNLGLDFTATRDDGREYFRFALEQLRQVSFDLRKQFGVVNDAVFDDLGEAGAEFTVGQGLDRVEVARDQRGW